MPQFREKLCVTEVSCAPQAVPGTALWKRHYVRMQLLTCRAQTHQREGSFGGNSVMMNIRNH